MFVWFFSNLKTRKEQFGKKSPSLLSPSDSLPRDATGATHLPVTFRESADASRKMGGDNFCNWWIIDGQKMTMSPSSRLIPKQLGARVNPGFIRAI